jgi:hypothetical protein
MLPARFERKPNLRAREDALSLRGAVLFIPYEQACRNRKIRLAVFDRGFCRVGADLP